MDVLEQGGIDIVCVELYNIWRNEGDKNKKFLAVLTYILEKMTSSGGKDLQNDEEVHLTVKNFCSNLRVKWDKVNRTHLRFLEKYKEWLNTSVRFTFKTTEPKHFASSSVIGRPPKEFSSLSDQSKRQRVKELIESYSTEELLFAARISLYDSGNRDAASLIKVINQSSPAQITEMKKKLFASQTTLIKYTKEEALALFVDANLSKRSYTLIQQKSKAKCADIYPSYIKLLDAKTSCYPPPDTTEITETSAEVKVQAIVDLTARRLCVVQEDVLINKFGIISQGLQLFYKWGCDGSGGHSMYKQKFDNNEFETDFYMFSVCCVPLCLQTKDGLILWNNPRPSSTRFCRPLKICFMKESTELTRKEIDSIESQIKNLVPTVVMVNGIEIAVTSHFKLTMIDGKTFSAISETSTQCCGICGATPKQMNNLAELYKRSCNISMYDYGLSSLHAYIRTFEYLLHISYRLPIRKWRISDTAEKEIVENTKKSIIDRFKKETGLLVDVPKPGYGSTNDGNTAARFFQSPDQSSLITGLDRTLIARFGALLECISSGYSVNIDCFDIYAKQTAELCVSLYNWYPMPSSVHKLLIHGPAIINSCSLPIGMYSEEALESRNKDLRKFRLMNSRKNSRQNNMKDLLHCLLFSSDPVISSISKQNSHRTNDQQLSSDAMAMLNVPNLWEEEKNNPN